MSSKQRLLAGGIYRQTLETPRGRLRETGPAYLSLPELVGLVLDLPVPQATQILDTFDGLPGLAAASLPELMNAPGIGESKAARLKAALELGRQLTLVSNSPDRPWIRSPLEIANLVRGRMDESVGQEQMWVVALGSRCHVLDVRMIYQGNVGSIVVRPAEVFRPAVRVNAPSIVIVHNHPSGEATPSPEDIGITREIVKAGHNLAIKVLDHVILGGGKQFVSLKERGVGFP